MTGIDIANQGFDAYGRTNLNFATTPGEGPPTDQFLIEQAPIAIILANGTLIFSSPALIVDIKPGSDPNGVNPRSKALIPVAVLGSVNFDATQVDFTTVVFGPSGASPAHQGHVEDVNNDGFADMTFHFRSRDTGIACGDTEATLTGQTFGGDEITGTDSVLTASCR